jgi:hypothetical protein
VSAVAELLPDPGRATLGLAPAPRGLGLPPGSVPVEPVRSAIRSYRAGTGTRNAERLTTMVDLHSDALEAEIGRLVVAHLAEFTRGVARLEFLHARTVDLLAQKAWLRSFPCDTDQRAVPMSIRLGSARVEMPVVLEALRAATDLGDRRMAPGPRRAPGRRGAAASMAALADAGQTTTAVANACGHSPSRCWAMLNGRQPTTPELRDGLQQLLGMDQAAIVLAGIPQLPRARRAAGAAIKALQDAGVRTEDLAALIPVQPGTLRRWLRGSLRPSPKLGPALEQLVDVETAARLVALIPPQPRVRAPSSPALEALKAAGATPENVGLLIGADHTTIRKWLRGSVRAPPQLAGALEQLVDVEAAAQIISLIPPLTSVHHSAVTRGDPCSPPRVDHR